MLSQLQWDLRELSQEARKKENELKEAAENALVELKSITEKHKDSQEQFNALKNCNGILQPFLTALSICSSVPKVGFIALSGINKMVSYHSVPEVCSYLTSLLWPLHIIRIKPIIPTFQLTHIIFYSSFLIDAQSKLGDVIGLIAMNVDGGYFNDASSLLKVMQTIVAMLTPPAPPVNPEDLCKALTICFRLHASKVPGLHQPAEASLRQIVSSLLDRTWVLWNESQISSSKETQSHVTSEPVSNTPQNSSSFSSALAPETSTSTTEQTIPTSSHSSSLPETRPSSSKLTKQKPSDKDRAILDSTRILRDIIHLASGDQAVWLSIQTLDVNFCLEIIEEFLTIHKSLALHCPEFISIVKDRIGPILIQLLGHKRDFSFMIRLLRCCVAFANDYFSVHSMICVSILTSIRSYLSSSQAPWIQVLTLETFRWICRDSDSLLSSLISKESYNKEKPQLFDAFIKLVGELGKYVTTHILKMEGNDFVYKPPKPRFIDQLATSVDISSQVNSIHVISLSLNCFVAMTDLLSIHVTQFESKPIIHHESLLTSSLPINESTEYNQNRQKTPTKESQSLGLSDFSESSSSLQSSNDQLKESTRRLCIKLCESCWPSILASLSGFLQKTRDESMIQAALKSYQSFTNTCGILQLKGPRSSFLESITKFALPAFASSGTGVSTHSATSSGSISPLSIGFSTTFPTSPSASSINPSTGISILVGEEEYRSCKFTKKNISSMKTLLNIAHCMGSMLDTNWTIIVETLNHLHGILTSTRRTRNVGFFSGISNQSSSNASISSNDDGTNSVDSSSSNFLLEAFNLNIKSRNPPTTSSGSSGSLNNAGNSSSGSLSNSSSTSSPLSQYSLNVQDSSAALSQDFPTREEIEILGSALESLFTTSVYISDDGFIDFSNALMNLSRVQLDSMSENSNIKQISLFGFASIIKLSKHNFPRIALIWNDLHKHILYACSSNPNQATRQFAAKISCSLIEEGVSCITKPPFVSLSKESPLFMSALLMQVRLFETIEALKDSRHEQIRIETLTSLHRILSNSGTIISSGWHVVLGILLSIGVSKEIALIPIGFKCVETITYEYLPALPFDSIAVTISTIGNFGGKSIADININIAAIGLLWKVADFVAKRQFTISASEVSSDPTSPSSTSTNSTTSSYIDSLWIALLQELASRIDNLRSEIRDCALATLYGVLISYGNTFNITTWTNIVEKLLIPCIPWIMKQVDLAMKEPSAEVPSLNSSSNLIPPSNNNSGNNNNIVTSPNSGSMVSSNSPGGSSSNIHNPSNSSASNHPQIAHHHSRNTLAKQWQETQVNFIANMSRVFKAFLPSHLAHLPSGTFQKLYTLFLDHLEQWTNSPNLEVAHQSVTAVAAMILSSISLVPDSIDPSDRSSNDEVVLDDSQPSSNPQVLKMLHYSWRTFQKMALATGSNRSQSRLITYFVESLEEIHASIQRKKCDAIQVERVLNILQPLLYIPLELAGEYSVLHKQVFPFLNSIVSPTGSYARHSLSIVVQIASMLFKFASLALGLHSYIPSCYIPSKNMNFQLGLSNQIDSNEIDSNSPPLNKLLQTGSLSDDRMDAFESNLNISSTTSASISHTSSPDSLSPNLSSPNLNLSSSKSSWNVNNSSLEKNFFNLAEKSIQLLTSIWNDLHRHQYIPLLQSGTLKNMTEDELKFQCDVLKLKIYPDLAMVIGFAIQVNHLDPKAKFWAPSMELFTKAARNALPLLSISEKSEIRTDMSLGSKPSETTNAIDDKSAHNVIEDNINGSAADDYIVLRSKSPSSFSDIDKNMIWTTVIDSIESFLMSLSDHQSTNQRAANSPIASSGMQKSSSLNSIPSEAALAAEARLIELISTHLIIVCPNLPNLHNRLFQILMDGCDLTWKEAFMKQCYCALFTLVDQSFLKHFEYEAETTDGSKTKEGDEKNFYFKFSSPEIKLKVSQLALPHVMRKCKSLISKFIIDDKRSGALPLPSSRVSEVTFVLEQLKTLRIDSRLWGKPATVESLTLSTRRHLWELYPLFCDCISSKETEFKIIIQGILKDCGKELGLE